MQKSTSQSSFGKRGANESGVNYLRGSKVGSATGYISVGGQILGLPHGRRSKSSSLTRLRFDSTSEQGNQFKESPYCYASMDRKPLCPYDANAYRSRLAIDDAPVPYKNASTIDFNDGIHTCHKRRFMTTQQNHYQGEHIDPRSHNGIVSDSFAFRRKQQER